jgi:hypothetical protein
VGQNAVELEVPFDEGRMVELESEMDIIGTDQCCRRSSLDGAQWKRIIND